MVDPSAASFIACIRRHAQFRVLPADNQVLEGIQLVSELLNQQKLRICAGCQDILREFGLYCWDESAMRDAPKKEHDHAMDDMRYFARTILGRNPQQDFVALAAKR